MKKSTKSIINQFENSGNIAEVEINYKAKIKSSELPKIGCSEDAFKILKDVWSDKIEYVEEMVVLLINKANKVLGWVKISQGGVSGTICDPKIIFQVALNANASGVILAHNHPSGALKPSDADIRLTKKVKEAGQLLEIQILDHLIITSEGYYSFADECMM